MTASRTQRLRGAEGSDTRSTVFRFPHESLAERCDEVLVRRSISRPPGGDGEPCRERPALPNLCVKHTRKPADPRPGDFRQLHGSVLVSARETNQELVASDSISLASVALLAPDQDGGAQCCPDQAEQLISENVIVHMVQLNEMIQIAIDDGPSTPAVQVAPQEPFPPSPVPEPRNSIVTRIALDDPPVSSPTPEEAPPGPIKAH